MCDVDVPDDLAYTATRELLVANTMFEAFGGPGHVPPAPPRLLLPYACMYDEPSMVAETHYATSPREATESRRMAASSAPPRPTQSPSRASNSEPRPAHRENVLALLKIDGISSLAGLGVSTLGRARIVMEGESQITGLGVGIGGVAKDVRRTGTMYLPSG